MAVNAEQRAATVAWLEDDLAAGQFPLAAHQAEHVAALAGELVPAPAAPEQQVAAYRDLTGSPALGDDDVDDARSDATPPEKSTQPYNQPQPLGKHRSIERFHRTLHPGSRQE